jgi:hypothetical protein
VIWQCLTALVKDRSLRRRNPLVRSNELLNQGFLTTAQRKRVPPLVDEMRAEVTLGQYLDLVCTDGPVTTSNRISRGALVGANRDFLNGLTTYATPQEGIPTGRRPHRRLRRPGRHRQSTLDDLREGQGAVLITQT